MIGIRITEEVKTKYRSLRSFVRFARRDEACERPQHDSCTDAGSTPALMLARRSYLLTSPSTLLSPYHATGMVLGSAYTNE